MSFRVTFKRNGTQNALTFASEGQANTYARSVNGTVTPVNVEAPTVEVRKCAPPPLEIQERASKHFYCVDVALMLTVRGHHQVPVSTSISKAFKANR